MEEEIAYAKVHYQGSHRILAACDKEVMGRRLNKNGNIITIGKEFYGEDTVTENGLKIMAMGVESINLLGSVVVDIFISDGLLDRSSVILVDGIPHAQIYFL